MLLHIQPSNTPHCPPYQPFLQSKGEKYLNWMIWFHSNLCRKATEILSHYTTNNAYLVFQILCPRKTSVITHVWYLEFVGHKHLLHFHRWCMLGVQNFRLWIHCCTTTNNAYLHLVIEILGHRNVTKLQLIMHAWYLEFWTMYKNFTFPTTINDWFSNIWATHALPQGLTRLIPPILATSALLFCPEIWIH